MNWSTNLVGEFGTKKFKGPGRETPPIVRQRNVWSLRWRILWATYIWPSWRWKWWRNVPFQPIPWFVAHHPAKPCWRQMSSWGAGSPVWKMNGMRLKLSTTLMPWTYWRARFKTPMEWSTQVLERTDGRWEVGTFLRGERMKKITAPMLKGVADSVNGFSSGVWLVTKSPTEAGWRKTHPIWCPVTVMCTTICMFTCNPIQTFALGTCQCSRRCMFNTCCDCRRFVVRIKRALPISIWEKKHLCSCVENCGPKGS